MPAHSLETAGEEDVQFHVDMEEENEDAPLISNALTAVHSQRSVMASDMAEKLDIMMTISFEYIHSSCHGNGETEPCIWFMLLVCCVIDGRLDEQCSAGLFASLLRVGSTGYS